MEVGSAIGVGPASIAGELPGPLAVCAPRAPELEPDLQLEAQAELRAVGPEKLSHPEGDNEPAAEEKSSKDGSSEGEQRICVVCWVNDAGHRLQPCGHDHFCKECSRHFRTCPLCRRPLVHPGDRARPGGARGAQGPRPWDPDVRIGEVGKTVTRGVFLAALCCWFFIFCVGALEWLHELPKDGCSVQELTSLREDGSSRPLQGAEAGHAATYEDAQSWSLYNGESRHADAKSHRGCKSCNQHRRCSECLPGYISGGWQCFEHVDDLPPVSPGAALGSRTYHLLIIAVQAVGALLELALVIRLMRAGTLPRKDLFILLTALGIELTRMLVVDFAMLHDYIGDSSHQVFRAGLPCNELELRHNSSSTSSAFGVPTPSRWLGPDGRCYSEDASPYDPSSLYYIATHREAFAEGLCPTFRADSPLLDYGVFSGPPLLKGGHPRFSHLGWVTGGEFALFFLFATFANEVADVMFVVPSTTPLGWRCKWISLALELVQLGALCPVAVFTRDGCLAYTGPQGLSLHTLRDLVVWFGYGIWSFFLVIVPMSFVSLFTMTVLATLFLSCATLLARRFGSRSRVEISERWTQASMTTLQQVYTFNIMGGKWICGIFITMSLLPLMLAGMFLGVITIRAQVLTTRDQVLTSVALLSDVIFKIVATVLLEVGDYVLHQRVVNAVRLGQGNVNGRLTGHLWQAAVLSLSRTGGPWAGGSAGEARAASPGAVAAEVEARGSEASPAVPVVELEVPPEQQAPVELSEIVEV